MNDDTLKRYAFFGYSRELFEGLQGEDFTKSKKTLVTKYAIQGNSLRVLQHLKTKDWLCPKEIRTLDSKILCRSIYVRSFYFLYCLKTEANLRLMMRYLNCTAEISDIFDFVRVLETYSCTRETILNEIHRAKGLHAKVVRYFKSEGIPIECCSNIDKIIKGKKQWGL